MENNLYLLPEPDPQEIVRPVYQTAGTTVEQIISRGQTTDWQTGACPEWVALLAGHAVIAYADGRPDARLNPGDWLLIPAGVCHRVAYTSADPACIWLCVFDHTAGS